jgi:hypothetical protein
VTAAPFFNDAEGLRPIAYDSWWKDVAGGARLDILALQDGIGVGHAKLNDVGEWFRGMSEELANTRVACYGRTWRRLRLRPTVRTGRRQ